MTTPRRVLGPISGNIQKRKELSLYVRGKIIGARLANAMPAQILQQLNLHDSTIRTTIRRNLLRNNGESQPRPSQPKSYTDQDVRNLVRHVRINLKDTYAQVQRALGFTFCDNTIKAMLKPLGITNWRCKRRLHLTPKAAKDRLA
jgi:IS30 family transposase